MKNIIIWGLTPVLGFFIGAFAAGILEAAMGFSSINFDSSLGMFLMFLGMIPAYLIVSWVESKIRSLYEKKQTPEELEEMIGQMGKKENTDLWENEDFLQNDINK